MTRRGSAMQSEAYRLESWWGEGRAYCMARVGACGGDGHTAWHASVTARRDAPVLGSVNGDAVTRVPHSRQAHWLEQTRAGLVHLQRHGGQPAAWMVQVQAASKFP